MTLKVIGAGVGRTGTYSLKLALNELGFEPCFHMEEVVKNGPIQIPLWVSAVNGDPDWESIYKGYGSAVDWPTGRYYRELNKAYPEAKFILTHRDPLTWAQSFQSTIYKLLAEADRAPVHMRAWLQMTQQVISENGFPPGMDEQELSTAFSAHCDAVKETVPASRLLCFQVKEGWGPLCSFLHLPVPDTAFPRTNDRSEFWDLIASVS